MPHSMNHLLLVFALFAASSYNIASSIFNKASKLITSDLQTIKDPIDKSIMNALSNQCGGLKSILEENSKREYENTRPDLSSLQLEFWTSAWNAGTSMHTNFTPEAIPESFYRQTSIIYNLSEAAELIPSSRWFKREHKVIIYIHGFNDGPTKESYRNISKAFLKRGDYNVLALDASSLLGLDTLYVGATTNVQYIGQKLGAMLANLFKIGSNPLSIYLIGHSLGAHIASFTGKTFTALTGQLVGRITGLDPAGPCFTNVSDHLKLNASDAQFVDVIHTDAGVYGINERRGHVDFKPNGGSAQPNCLLQTCSHSRAWLLYAETVMFSRAMPGVRCRSWEGFKKGQCNKRRISYMGFGCSKKTRGRYYLQTAGSIPYGLGINGTKYVAKGGVIRRIGSAMGVV